MMRNSRFFFVVVLALLTGGGLTGCDASTSMGEEEVAPRTGRGATVSVTLLAEKSAAQINSEFAALGFPVPTSYAVSVYKIVYETVDAEGAATQASGALFVPQNAPGARPLMSYQHGTLVTKDEAPSAGGGEQAVGLAFATGGYVAALPDLLGLGDSPGFHPYVHAKTSATAVVDMLRAVHDFAAANEIDLNGQLFLTGYSQGGYTAMAAHREIQAAHADEFEITASAPMAGPYDLSGVMTETFTDGSTHPAPYYLPYTLLAYNAIYGIFETDAEMFAEPYDTLLPPLFDGTHSGGAINAVLPAVPGDILNPDLVAVFETDPSHPLRVRLRENDVYDWTPQAPVRLYHCGQDRHVPPANTQVALQRFQERGVAVSFIDPLPTADHGACAGPSLLLAKLWFDTMVQ